MEDNEKRIVCAKLHMKIKNLHCSVVRFVCNNKRKKQSKKKLFWVLLTILMKKKNSNKKNF